MDNMRIRMFNSDLGIYTYESFRYFNRYFEIGCNEFVDFVIFPMWAILWWVFGKAIYLKIIMSFYGY